MKLSKKKKEALSRAIHETIISKRLSIVRPNNNLVYTPVAVDEILFKLELQLYKAIWAALEIEE